MIVRRDKSRSPTYFDQSRGINDFERQPNHRIPFFRRYGERETSGSGLHRYPYVSLSYHFCHLGACWRIMENVAACETFQADISINAQLNTRFAYAARICFVVLQGKTGRVRATLGRWFWRDLWCETGSRQVGRLVCEPQSGTKR